MRLAFMGSPDFAIPALRALRDAGHEIVAVYCQPPKPAGRGQALRRCPVHIAAERLGLPVRTPAGLRRDQAVQQGFAELDLDAAVVAAYGLILPQAMLDAPRHGCLNIHASLLPRWRGAAPIQAAILAGDAQTGVTIMRMDAGLDTGPWLLREPVPIPPRATAAALHDVLAEVGAHLVLQALALRPPPVAQPREGAVYAPKLSRADARIDWTQAAVAIDRQVRAFDPWPGTFTLLHGAALKVLAAEPAAGAADTVGGDAVGGDAMGGDAPPPGTVVNTALTVACGEGALRLTRVQLAGRPAMPAEDFLRGHKVPVGTLLGQ